MGERELFIRPQIIVEVGHGLVPLVEGWNPLSPGSIYIGVENHSRRQMPYRLTLQKDLLKKHDNRIQLLQADGEALPFISESVDEVIFSNVAGFRLVDEKPLLLEAVRILAPSGRIVVTETISPNIARAIDILTACGMKCDIHNTTSISWPKLRKRYIHPSRRGENNQKPDNPKWLIAISEKET